VQDFLICLVIAVLALTTVHGLAAVLDRYILPRTPLYWQFLVRLMGKDGAWEFWNRLTPEGREDLARDIETDLLRRIKNETFGIPCETEPEELLLPKPAESSQLEAETKS
jgi:hypothetical protein